MPPPGSTGREGERPLAPTRGKLPPLLLLCSSAGAIAQMVAACLKRAGGPEVHLLVAPPRPAGHDLPSPARFSRYIRGYYQTRSSQPEDRLDAVRSAVKRSRAGVIMPVDEDAVELAGRATREQWCRAGVTPLPDAQTLRQVTDKSSLAEYLASRGLPAPPTWDAWSLGRARDEARDRDFPLLAKPCSGQGGLGIREIRDHNELEKFLAWQESTGAAYILQKKASGPTVDINVLFDNGRLLACCAQQTLNHGWDGLEYARTVRIFRDEILEDMARDLLGPLKCSGVAHIDLVWQRGEERPWFLEVNGRYWATLFGSLLAGINFPWLSYTMALGLPWPEPEFRPIIYSQGGRGLLNGLRRLAGGRHPYYDFRYTDSALVLRDPVYLLARAGRAMRRLTLTGTDKDDPARQLEYNPG